MSIGGIALRTAARIQFVDTSERELPAWPVLVLLWGIPAWWLFGLLPFISVVLAFPMLAFLIRQSSVRITPGILPWFALVAWMVPCALMLDTTGHLVGYLVQFAQFASIAVILVYVVNAPQTLTVPRLMHALTFTWVFVIIGGYLGLLWPDTVLTFTVGQLLPASIRNNDYVSDLVFPPFAEAQLPYGAQQPFLRPAAPFAYTNGWGAEMAILTPVAIGSAIHNGRKLAYILLFCGIVAAVPPSIATSDRGLFLGLIVSVVYVAVRLAARRAWRTVILVAALAVVAAISLVAAGLVDTIVDRQDTVDTTAGRGALYAETFQRTLTSPLLGFGGPRASYTSEISVGSQGMIWELMFSFGFVGLALFAWFIIGAVVRTWGAPSESSIWLHSSLIAVCLLSVFYGLDRHLVTIAIVVAMTLRERYVAHSYYWTHSASGRPARAL
jgi:hypothetical protein